MKKGLIAAVIVCASFTACGMPMMHEVATYTQAPDFLYTKMILTLQELGWTIKNMDKPSFLILAEIGIGLAAAYPYQASIMFTAKENGAEYSITITQPAGKIKTGVPDDLAAKIKEKFEANIKK